MDNKAGFVVVCVSENERLEFTTLSLSESIREDVLSSQKNEQLTPLLP
jgi:hypothetical protein